MLKDTNIIDLPIAPVARRTRQTDQTTDAAAVVIDLKSRNQASAFESKALRADGQSDHLSPGEVWDALNSDRLVVHYQPQYDMQSGKPVAAEALVRLIDTDGELVFPDRFIDPVESRDLIVPLGREVIEHVCVDLARFRARGLAIKRIAINLSAYQLTADTGLLSFVDQTVTRHGLQHEDLEFELTERHSLQTQSEGHEVLCALADRGARIVIDDFGVGYSSVVYLAELPVSAFKLDRALVAGLHEDGPARTLIDGLLALARNMGHDVVAEGVETKAQGDYLEAAGCPLAQGYGYARPMSVDYLMALVAEENIQTEFSSIRA